MATTKISELPEDTSDIDSADVLPVVVDSTTKKITTGNFISLLSVVKGPSSTTNNNIPLWDSTTRLLKDGLDPDGIDAGFTFTSSSAAGRVNLRLGGTTTEGLEFTTLEETIAMSGAIFQPLTNTIPAGAVILSVQSNVEVACAAGGTTVTVSLGLNASDPDKYGTHSSDTFAQQSKISTIADWVVLSSAEQIDVCGCVSGGATLGDTNFSAGSVRVRIVYLALANLDNA